MITGAEDIAWDIDTLIEGTDVHELLDDALIDAKTITELCKGTIGTLEADELAVFYDRYAELVESMRRASAYASLQFATDTANPAHGALLQQVSEKSAAIAAELVWIELEWLDVDEERARALIDDPRLAAHKHHLDTARLGRPHTLSEPEERLLAVKGPTGRSAWVRLYTQLTAGIRCRMDGQVVSLETALAGITHPDRARRQASAKAVTAGLQPGLRTRAYAFNTLLADKASDDKLRGYPTWITAWNQAQETTDESVDALVEAVVSRYDIPQRWYALKAKVVGVERLADYDRSCSVAETETHVPWDAATRIVRDAYASFSPELAAGVERFLTEGWIDAPVREGKRGGAFCSYTVPGHHPYVFLNYTATPGDVLTLAHELGHGLHGLLARSQGVFHQSTPLTLAETASVFGETVTFERLLTQVTDPGERFALLAQNVEGAIATVFRQVAMNRFEHAVHTHRRDVGELSVDDFGDHWIATQQALFGDAVEATEDYRSWWSYIGHFIGTPGYVYAYAYGQLLALSVYARYAERGDVFVPAYLDLLSAGGSRWPEELGKIVDCDLDDPGFWAAGLDIVESQLVRAEQAAVDAGRV